MTLTAHRGRFLEDVRVKDSDESQRILKDDINLCENHKVWHFGCQSKAVDIRKIVSTLISMSNYAATVICKISERERERK